MNPLQLMMAGQPNASNFNQYSAPYGAMGFNYGTQSNAYNQMLQQALQANAMNLQQRGSEMSDYQKDEARREAERQAAIKTAAATSATIGREKEAGVKKTELENQFQQGTLASRTAATNAGNEAVTAAHAMDTLSQGTQAIMSAGPAWKSVVESQLQASHAPQQIMQVLSQAQTPEEYLQRLGQLNAVFEQRLSQREKMAQATAGNATRIEVAKISAEATREAARIRAAAQVAASKADKYSLEQLMSRAMEKARTSDGEERAMWQEEANRIGAFLYNKAQAGFKGYPGIGNIPGQNPQPFAAPYGGQGGGATGDNDPLRMRKK